MHPTADRRPCRPAQPSPAQLSTAQYIEMWTWSKWFSVTLPRLDMAVQPEPLLMRWLPDHVFDAELARFLMAQAAIWSPSVTWPAGHGAAGAEHEVAGAAERVLAAVVLDPVAADGVGQLEAFLDSSRIRRVRGVMLSMPAGAGEPSCRRSAAGAGGDELVELLLDLLISFSASLRCSGPPSSASSPIFVGERGRLVGRLLPAGRARLRNPAGARSARRRSAPAWPRRSCLAATASRAALPLLLW